MNPANTSPEIECKVLCSLMHIGEHKNSRVQKSFLKLSSDCFSKPLYAKIFLMLKDLFNRQESFNFVDILILIPKNDNDLHMTHTQLIEHHQTLFVSARSLEDDVDNLVTLKSLRKQINLAQEMVAEIKNIPDPKKAQKTLSDYITEISNHSFLETKDGVSNIQIAEDYFNADLPDDLIIPTTCDQLNDALNGGVMSKSLITIAAGAGVGKTGFAIWLMDSIARMQNNSQSLFFSLEMESRHIWMRHVGVSAGVQFDKMDEEKKRSAITKSLMIPVRIYDSSTTRMASDIDYIITTSRLKAMEKSISVIVVDYLGLVQNRGTFERNDLKQSDITTKLANLAMELNCVVIVLSQINRSASGRAKDDQCPYPSDAADSSGSHRSSTLWLGVDRPELYQDCPSYKNQFVIKCRKNRFGGTFEMVLAFNEGTFAEVPQDYFRKPFAHSKNNEQALFSSPHKEF